MPKNQPVPKKAKFSPNSEMGNPSVYSIVKPRAMVSMASVATNGGILKRVMVNPLKKPDNEPMIKPAKIAPNKEKPMNKLRGGMEMPFLSNPAVIAPLNAKTEPTERSIPAVRTTKVMPTEMTILTEI